MTFKIPTPRSEILRSALDTHGSIDYAEIAEIGLNAEDVLNFSVNNNPFGPSQTVQAAIANAPLDRYPDRECLALRRAIGRKHNVLSDQVLVGNGASELIWLAAFAYLKPQDHVVVLGPTFGEYERSSMLMGAHVHMVLMHQPGRLIKDDPTELFRRVRPKLVFICHPNTPTGMTIDLDRINKWCRSFPETLFVIDEVYLPFTPEVESALVLDAPNSLVIRSITKEHSMAGLRLGFAIGHEDVIDGLSKSRPPWNVNGLAQAAGLAALQDDDHMRNSLVKLRHAKQKLIHGLEEIGYRPLPSLTHFFLVETPQGSAAEFRQRLLRRKILVRDCTSFGLPRHVRIATLKDEKNEQLLAAMAHTTTWW